MQLIERPHKGFSCGTTQFLLVLICHRLNSKVEISKPNCVLENCFRGFLHVQTVSRDLVVPPGEKSSESRQFLMLDRTDHQGTQSYSDSSYFN
jgi:hypothetical protein